MLPRCVVVSYGAVPCDYVHGSVEWSVVVYLCVATKAMRRHNVMRPEIARSIEAWCSQYTAIFGDKLYGVTSYGMVWLKVLRSCKFHSKP